MEVNLEALSSASESLTLMRRSISAVQDQLYAAKFVLSECSMPFGVTNGFTTIDDELIRLDTGLGRLSEAADSARRRYRETEREVAEGSDMNAVVRADITARFNRVIFRPLRPSDQQYISTVRNRIVSVILGRKEDKQK